MRLLLLSFLLSFSYPVTAIAAVTATVVSPYFWRYEITEEITETDAIFFEKLIKTKADMGRLATNPIAIHILLNSNGGSVRAAMRIGRASRILDALVRVAPNGKCISSCVFILAGAGRRGIYEGGRVGIHRPYARQSFKTTPDIERKHYKDLEIEITTFLLESDIDPQLFRDMMLVPPDQVRILTEAEVYAYGLDNDAPYIQESDARNAAAKLGISREEYAYRSALAAKMCPHSDFNFDVQSSALAYLECKDRVLKTGK